MNRSKFLLTLAGILALPVALKSKPKNEPVTVYGLNGNIYLVDPDHLRLISSSHPEGIAAPDYNSTLLMKYPNYYLTSLIEKIGSAPGFV